MNKKQKKEYDDYLEKVRQQHGQREIESLGGVVHHTEAQRIWDEMQKYLKEKKDEG